MKEKINFENNFSKEQKEKIEKIKDLRHSIVKTIIENKDYNTFYEITKSFEEENLKSKDCYLYHILIGNSITLPECDCFDLKGDKSILKLAQKILKDIKD